MAELRLHWLFISKRPTDGICTAKIFCGKGGKMLKRVIHCQIASNGPQPCAATQTRAAKYVEKRGDKPVIHCRKPVLLPKYPHSLRQSPNLCGGTKESG